MSGYSTGIIEKNLSDCDDLQQLKQQILPLLQDQRTAWTQRMEAILQDISCKQLAQLCKVSEPAVRKWRRGALPQSRDMYIRIGFAAGYDLGQMNAFLQRYGKCPQLYVRSLEDSVCIFVLQSDTLPHTYETYRKLLDMVRHALQDEPKPVHAQRSYSTTDLSGKFSDVQSMEQMIGFVQEHAGAYRQAYGRLYSYVIAFLQVNLERPGDRLDTGRRPSFHAMATESQWPSSLRHCISEIRAKRWFPLRHKVISLGLHLNMDTEGINRMLQYAQMEPLYPKSPVEAAIVWAIEEKKLSSWEDQIIPDGSSELYDYVRNVLAQLELSDSEFFADHL